MTRVDCFCDSRARLAASAGALPAIKRHRCKICAERMRISTCLRPAALWAWGGCEHPFLQPAWRPAPKFELFHFSPVRSADLSRAGGYAVIKGVCCNTATTTVVAGAGAYAAPAPAARWAEPWRAEVSWGVSDAPTNVSGFHGLLLRSLRRLTTTFVSSKHGLSRGRPSCLQHFKLPAPVFSLNIDPSRFRHLLPSIYAPVASSRRARRARRAHTSRNEA